MIIKIILLFFTLFSGTAFSQQQRVLKIVDVDSGEPLTNAQVIASDKIYNPDDNGLVVLNSILPEEKISVTCVNRENEVRFPKHFEDTIEIKMHYTGSLQLLIWAEEDSMLNSSYREFDNMYETGTYNSGNGLNGAFTESNGYFPGGMDALSRYLSLNMHYPYYCVQREIEGKVWVQFRVQKDGQVTHVKAVRKAHPGLDREAVRIVRAMPLWQPGSTKGQAVVTYYTLPITFKLE